MQRMSMEMVNATIMVGSELRHGSVAVHDGLISGKSFQKQIDLTNYLVLPGIVDLHGDAFEHHLTPRPTSPFPISSCLSATDADAASNGITTAFMAHSWSWEGGYRSPDHAKSFLQSLADYKNEMRTDLRVQLRVETHTIDTKEDLLKTLREHNIEYIVLNNHLNEAIGALEKDPAKLHFWAKQNGHSFEQHVRNIKSATDQSDRVSRYLHDLTTALVDLSVIFGSHDDQDAETRNYFSMIGAKICEFPTSWSAAAAAYAKNEPIIMGAPNIVRGGSQAGNISAIEVVNGLHCSALVSDYYYPTMSRAAFILHEKAGLSLPNAWAKISTGPANILALNDRGRIELGKRADLTIVNKQTRNVEATICFGRITFMAGEAANRFLGIKAIAGCASE